MGARDEKEGQFWGDDTRPLVRNLKRKKNQRYFRGEDMKRKEGGKGQPGEGSPSEKKATIERCSSS